MHAPLAKKGKKSATNGEATKAKDSKQAADDRKQRKEVCALFQGKLECSVSAMTVQCCRKVSKQALVQWRQSATRLTGAGAELCDAVLPDQEGPGRHQH